jgi:hypothetical protein
MRFVAPPTHVGEDLWPVLSAVRVNTDCDPAEFVVLVDCGEGMPLHPYATLQVNVWTRRRTRRKVSDGEYNLTFEQAQRSLGERAGLVATTTATVEVVFVRNAVHDPDTANDYAVFVNGTHRPDGRVNGRADGVRVITYDIDPGAVEITPAWVEQHLESVVALSSAAARLARDAVLAYADDIAVDDEQADDVAEPEDPISVAGPEGLDGAT